MSEKESEQRYDTHPKHWEGDPPKAPNPWDIERRVSLLEQSTKTIKDELTKINNNISKLVWIVLAAIILAGLNVIFSGGAPAGG